MLQPFQYQVEHVAGRDNVEADALSRTWEDTLPTSGPFKRGGGGGGGGGGDVEPCHLDA